LQLAFDVLNLGGTAPAILNAANEVVVKAFLEGIISFTRIAQIIEMTLEQSQFVVADSLDVVLSADKQARIQAQSLVQKL
jgi:1-deoxy-D-xylulose-5-phosphate reductoisomerase